MEPNLTRFYIDADNSVPNFKYRVVEDVETTEANEFEAKLQQENISYIRTDF